MKAEGVVWDESTGPGICERCSAGDQPPSPKALPASPLFFGVIAAIATVTWGAACAGPARRVTPPESTGRGSSEPESASTGSPESHDDATGIEKWGSHCFGGIREGVPRGFPTAAVDGDIAVESYPSAISPGRTVTIRWKPIESQPEIGIILQATTGAGLGWIMCRVPNTGEFEVPGSATEVFVHDSGGILVIAPTRDEKGAPFASFAEARVTTRIWSVVK